VYWRGAQRLLAPLQGCWPPKQAPGVLIERSFIPRGSAGSTGIQPPPPSSSGCHEAHTLEQLPTGDGVQSGARRAGGDCLTHPRGRGFGFLAVGDKEAPGSRAWRPLLQRESSSWGMQEAKGGEGSRRTCSERSPRAPGSSAATSSRRAASWGKGGDTPNGRSCPRNPSRTENPSQAKNPTRMLS